jgi:putative acetyltransferase
MAGRTDFMFLVAADPGDYRAARELFLEYARSLSFDRCFQNFEAELAGLGTMYAAPDGGLLLIRDGPAGPFVGCVGIRRIDARTAELKRMYVQGAYRKLGLGRALLERAIGLVRELGYKAVRLDTMPSMTRAVALYRQYGFREIEPYRFNPEPGALFFELEL